MVILTFILKTSLTEYATVKFLSFLIRKVARWHGRVGINFDTQHNFRYLTVVIDAEVFQPKFGHLVFSEVSHGNVEVPLFWSEDKTNIIWGGLKGFSAAHARATCSTYPWIQAWLASYSYLYVVCTIPFTSFQSLIMSITLLQVGNSLEPHWN